MTEVDLALLVRVLHFIGAVLWFGGLFATGSLLHFRDGETDAGVKQRLGIRARKAGILADLGALVSLGSGMYNAVIRHAFTQRWLHIKLTLVVVLVVIHVVVRVKAKRASDGEGRFGRGILGLATLVMIAILVVVVYQPFRK